METAMAKLTPATTPEREGRERAPVQRSQEDTGTLPLRGAAKDASRPAIWASPPPDSVLDELAECPGFSGRLPGVKRKSG